MKATSTSPTFALLGAAGFVAPRHLSAIATTGGQLLCACDPHDSVGILDRYFPRASFIREEAEFRQFLEEHPVDYVSICTPNHLHLAHTKLAVMTGSRAICEKPLALSGEDLSRLIALEQESGSRIFPVLQLRLHPQLRTLRQELERSPGHHQVELRYVTARGPWYHSSWKGRCEHSGGLAFAIGIHLLDLLLWLFGEAESSVLHLRSDSRIAGELRLRTATIRWFLSIDGRDLPSSVKLQGRSTFREIRVEGAPVEFSEKFDDLHQEVYREILAGKGLGPRDAGPAVALAEQLGQAEVSATIPAWLSREAS